MSKTIAFVIAFKDFKDEEYFIPKEIFERNGFEVKTVSWQKGIALGIGGGEAEIDLTLEELKDFDALVFAGGNGATRYFDDEKAHEVIINAFNQGKVIAAICIGPAILALAGILKGKKATVWHNDMNKSLIKQLQDKGAIFEDLPVVIDGNIITANGPAAAKEFADAVARVLTK